MLVLIARCPQTAVEGYNDGPLLEKQRAFKGIRGRVDRWEHRTYQSAYCYPPDIAVKLTVPIEVTILRKPKMTYERLKKVSGS